MAAPSLTGLSHLTTVAAMNRRLLRVALWMFLLLGLAQRSPAPLVFTPGEGWRYEKAGGEGSWSRTRARDQLDVAQKAFDAKDYGLALKAARRTVKVWPFSDYAPQAQYLVVFELCSDD